MNPTVDDKLTAYQRGFMCALIVDALMYTIAYMQLSNRRQG